MIWWIIALGIFLWFMFKWDKNDWHDQTYLYGDYNEEQKDLWEVEKEIKKAQVTRHTCEAYNYDCLKEDK